MIGFGFAIITAGEVAKLQSFKSGLAASSEISSFPSDFKSRSIVYDKDRIGAKAVLALTKGPLPQRELVREVGQSRRVLSRALKNLPQIKRVGNYYGLNEDEIYRWLLTRKTIGPVLYEQVQAWLAQLFLSSIAQHGSYRTVQFAAHLGVDKNAVKHVVHLLRKQGLIRKASDGTWAPGRDSSKDKRNRQ